MFEVPPSARLLPHRRFAAVLVASVLVAVAGSAHAADGTGRFADAEARSESLIHSAMKLRRASPEARSTRVAALIDHHVDLEAWLGDAVPSGHRLRATERALLLDRTQRLLIARAIRHLEAEGEVQVTLEKTRLDGREVAVDCLVHTADAIYEITLRWSSGPTPRLRDVRVEGVSVGAADRRRIRRAWEDGQLPAALAALDRAIGLTPSGAFISPPAVATRTTSDARPDADAAPPTAERPPGL